METPQISRSGRVLKKSAKVKEMEDFDINELDVQGGSKKSTPGHMSGKQIFKPSFQSPVKAKQDPRRSIYHDSSDASKESDSSSNSSDESSTTSSSSSEATEDDEDDNRFHTEVYKEKKVNLSPPFPIGPKLLASMTRERGSPSPSSGETTMDSEDASSDAGLVIAEDSDDSPNYPTKGQKVTAKKRGGKKDPTYAPRQIGPGRKKPAPKAAEAPGAKKKKPVYRSKPVSAYMMWYNEHQKKIAASSGNIGFGNLSKKMGEAWQTLPEKEKMAWRGKAKRQTVKATGNIINTGTNSAQNKASNRSAASISEEIIKGLTEGTGILGTSPIDAAAHLKLLGDSLTVIGQRLIEHEGQLAVSGIYSVLLDTLLCAIGPLMCLTTEIAGLENVSPEVCKRTLDHIAYFMPGL